MSFWPSSDRTRFGGPEREIAEIVVELPIGVPVVWQLLQLIQPSWERVASWNRTSPRWICVRSGCLPSGIVAVVSRSARLTTESESSYMLATNAVLPSGAIFTATGRRPTGNR